MVRALVSIVLLLASWPALAWEPGGDRTPLDRLLQNLGRGLDSAGRDVDRMLLEAQTQAAAAVFEQWLIQSRNAVTGAGASSIPPSIRQQLQGFYNADILDRTRFKIGDTGTLNLANLSMQYGDAAAVTLIDVIVFRNATDAYNNVLLWAHELKHVQQFRDWGTGGFVLRYLRHWESIEDEQSAFQPEFEVEVIATARHRDREMSQGNVAGRH